MIRIIMNLPLLFEGRKRGLGKESAEWIADTNQAGVRR
jgi:hypothetical protein